MKATQLFFIAGLSLGSFGRHFFNAIYLAPAKHGSSNENKTISEKRESLKIDSKLKEFTELLIESGSDKYYRHHYERYYKRWLSPFRLKSNLTFLEIGADTGRSLNLWENYFSDPQLLLGLAYSNSGNRVVQAGQRSERVSVFYGDQSRKETMNELSKLGPWDIIVDDGSHVPSHVVYTLFEMWNSVKHGGLYVIEDLETNYWKAGSDIYGYKLGNVGIGANPKDSAVTKLQQLLDVLVRHQIGATQLSVMPGDENICAIEWGMNIVLIRKCGSDDGEGPSFLEKNYDNVTMATWIKDARRTNPRKDKHGNLSPAGW